MATNESIDDDAELLALEKLLFSAEEKDNSKISNSASDQVPSLEPRFRPRLREDSTFAAAFTFEIGVPNPTKRTSDLEELDSSDDEEVKNFLERKYNEYGVGINKQLKHKKAAAHDAKVAREVTYSLSTCTTSEISSPNQPGTMSNSAASSHIKSPHNPIKLESRFSDSFHRPAAPAVGSNRGTNNSLAMGPRANPLPILTDPVFGMRLVNPLISSALLIERMTGRKAVAFSQIAFHTQRGDLAKDWVIAGVLINKSPVKMSKKGDPFSIWRLSDLRGEIKTVSLFLFSGAHKDLWKTAERTCVAVLNPSIFEKRAERGDVACLSIDTSQKIMVLGQSKDFGVCKARKKNGEPCTATVNLSECDYCVYHMKQEFKKMSCRSELQSSTAGRGLNELRNKVLGKSEVFYGGQSFSAVPAKKSAKLVEKDMQRISSLSEYAVSPFASSVNHASKPRSACSAVPYAPRSGPVSKVASNIEGETKQRLKDLERLKTLQNELNVVAKDSGNQRDQTTQIESVKNSATKTVEKKVIAGLPPDKFKNRSFSFATELPKLSREDFTIDINVNERQAQAAKLKALQVLKKKPIEKVNPNSIRGSREGKRRAIDELNEQFTNSDSKRRKFEEEQKEAERKSRIQRIMDATSSHTNLIDLREQQEQDKYFSKLEKKEALEEKMLNTYKMPCKAVICLQCKYTAFSAADRCKQERHTLKMVDAEKRFFQCKDCGNRSVSVFKLPKTSCNNCKGSRWIRAAMIRERKLCNVSEGLSVRGDEEKFLGSLATSANLNLLVPEGEN